MIESLENRAMLAGLGQDSLSGLGSITAVLLPGVSSPPGIVLTGGSPTLGSTAGTGGSQSTGPVLFCGTGSGAGSSTSGSSSSAPNGPVLLGGSGSGTGSSISGSSSSAPNGPVLSSQYTSGSNTGGQGTGTNNSGTLSGSDLWLLYGAGLGAASSFSGTTGGSSSNLLPLLSQYQEGSSDGGQGNGTGGTLTNADLWRLYWSVAGAGSSSGPANGSLANDPTISAKYTDGSGGGLVFFVTGATGGDAASSGSQQGSTGSNTLTLEEGVTPPRLTPLVFHPGSDDGPGFVSTVWTGDEGGVQFVLAAEQEKNQASQPLPIGKPGQLVFIVSGAQPGSQVPYSGTTATTTPVDGGSLVPPSGGASYSVFSAVGGLLNVIGGACQAAVGVNVVIAASAATVATEGGASPLTVPIAIGGSVVVVHGLDQVWAGVTTIYTGQTQRPYTAQALDPLTGNETTSDLANAGVGIVFSLGAGAYANGAKVAGQVASKGDEIATAVEAVAGRSDDAVGVVDDVAGSAGSSSASVAPGAIDPFLGTGSNKGFGQLIGWGVGAQDASARAASITLQEIQQAGVTRPVAEHWLNFYRNAAASNQGAATAPERIRLMERILELIGN